MRPVRECDAATHRSCSVRGSMLDWVEWGVPARDGRSLPLLPLLRLVLPPRLQSAAEMTRRIPPRACRRYSTRSDVSFTICSSCGTTRDAWLTARVTSPTCTHADATTATRGECACAGCARVWRSISQSSQPVACNTRSAPHTPTHQLFVQLVVAEPPSLRHLQVRDGELLLRAAKHLGQAEHPMGGHRGGRVSWRAKAEAASVRGHSQPLATRLPVWQPPRGTR